MLHLPCWTVHKTHHRFSDIPLDQDHEQKNAKLKGKGGVVGLTENPFAFRNWVITGPEVSILVEEFEHIFLTDKTLHVGNIYYYNQHQGFCLYTRENFKKKILRLVEVINDYGNRFTDDCNELLVSDSRNCANGTVISSLKQIEMLGRDQYHVFVSNVLESRQQSIHDPIINTYWAKSSPISEVSMLPYTIVGDGEAGSHYWIRKHTNF